MAFKKSLRPTIPEGLREFGSREVILPASPVGPVSISPGARGAGSAQAEQKPLKFDNNGALLTAENCVNINVIPFVTTTSSVRVLEDNIYRKYLLIQNNGADFIVVNFTNAAGLTSGLKMASNAVYEMLRPTLQAINIIGNSAGLNVIILEGT